MQVLCVSAHPGLASSSRGDLIVCRSHCEDDLPELWYEITYPGVFWMSDTQKQLFDGSAAWVKCSNGTDS